MESEPTKQVNHDFQELHSRGMPHRQLPSQWRGGRWGGCYEVSKFSLRMTCGGLGFEEEFEVFQVLEEPNEVQNLSA